MTKKWEPWQITALFVYINAMLLRILLWGMFGWPGWVNMVLMLAMAGIFIAWCLRHDTER